MTDFENKRIEDVTAEDDEIDEAEAIDEEKEALEELRKAREDARKDQKNAEDISNLQNKVNF